MTWRLIAREEIRRDSQVHAGSDNVRRKAVFMTTNWIVAMQIGSPIRRHHSQRETLIGLGLNRIRRKIVLPDTPEIRGMLRKVRHLVHVFERPLLGEITPAMKNDLDVLQRFNRRVTRTEQMKFWKRFAEQVPNVISRMDKMTLKKTGPTSFEMQGVIYSSLEGFDQDEIAAFVLDYRQYTQKNDAISISSMADIYERPWIHIGARKIFEEFRAQLNRALDTPSTMIFGSYQMSVRELVDIVVYGGLAHSNAEKAETFESWEKSGIMGFVWAIFFAAMRDLMRTLRQIRMLNEQVLSLADPARDPG
jgi:ribosomal protein L30